MGRLSIVVVANPEELACAGADLVADELAANPAAGIVVPTGRTPLGLYRELAHRREAGALDVSAATIFQLDEYLGIGHEDRRTLFGWMDRSFLSPLAIPGTHVVRLPTEGDIEAACAAHDREVRARGGYGLAILGLGMNGHLGFNEPPAGPDAPTREVMLSAASIASNAGYWGGEPDDVPRRAVTIGLGPLLAARKILLLVAGAEKRSTVHRMLHGPATPEVPASFLRQAGDVTIVLDEAAWCELEAAP